MKRPASFRNRPKLLLSLVLGAAFAAPSPAGAQPPPPPPAPPPAAQPPVGQPPAAQPSAAQPFVMPPAQPDPIAIALAPRPGGLTPEDVSKVVGRNKHSVRAKQEDLKAAAARVDQALVKFFPQVSLTASYTQLSPLTLPTVPFSLTVGGQKITSAFPIGQLFPIIVNNGQFQASIAVPVSDYIFRLAQSYSAASHNEKSARLAADAEALQAGADAKIAYFNWVRAKGAIVVSEEAVAQSKAHLEDAKKSFNVGLASRADVLRIDAQMAAAEQALAESIAFAAVAEEQLRVLLGVPATQPLEIGSDVMNEPATVPAETLAQLQEQAMAKRLEVRSVDESIASLKQAEAVTRAGYLPRIDAFGDAVEANPNQRYVPPTQQWVGTWDLGVRLSWTINDTFTTIGAMHEAQAHTAALVEQRGAVQDGLRVEVASAYADVIKAPPAIEAADRGMVAAEESLRVRRELFRNGKATSSELVDAEAEMTQARLRKLDAHIGLLVARARLDHAVGRDVPARPAAAE